MNTRSRHGFFAVLVLLGGSAGTAVAHHSVAGQFDVAHTVKLAGSISRVDWVNPHIYVYLDVKEGGAVKTWKLECLPVAMMRKAGVSKQTLIGDGQQVSVAVHPARNGTANLGFILNMKYSDGRSYQFSRDPNDKTDTTPAYVP